MAEASTTNLDAFRAETRSWLEANCPEGARGPGQIAVGSSRIELEPDVARWLEVMAERGWTTPTWPAAYGGGGLSNEEARVLFDEMGRLNARAPLGGMGVTMIGPTLLEFGTEEQKQRHLPDIIRGRKQWCQGYSEPNAGSDLAALKTRAEDNGDHFLLNGQKIWTSGASTADWMFALVRTDFDAPKHQGISFVLLSMDQPGVTVKPIKLLSGTSPFCETFLDNALARKEDLIGELNKGWTIGKRLLQYERSGIGGLSGGSRRGAMDASLVKTAEHYVGRAADGRIADPAARQALIDYTMRYNAFRLTAKRVNEENKSGTPGAATSIFKLVGAALQQDGAAMKRELMGTQGLGVDMADWGHDAIATELGYSGSELEAVREWLGTKATTIYGGSNEIQANIIAKRVLGLPD
ncbi:MAG: acyl-CoA dehydrogenase family protein [Pseudomonadota bacterium]